MSLFDLFFAIFGALVCWSLSLELISWTIYLGRYLLWRYFSKKNGTQAIPLEDSPEFEVFKKELKDYLGKDKSTSGHYL